MKERPRRVFGTAGPERFGTPLVPSVLLADGDPDACEMLRDALLEGTGPCVLRTVATAGELERQLSDGQPASAAPAVVLVDVDLPGADALETVRRLKCDGALRRIPVVVLATCPEPSIVAAAYDAGANTVIPKPVTFLALVRLVKVLTAYWLESAVLAPPQGAA